MGSLILKSWVRTFVISSVKTTLVPPSSTWSISMHLLGLQALPLRTQFSTSPERGYTLKFLKPTAIICAKMCFAQSTFLKKIVKWKKESGCTQAEYSLSNGYRYYHSLLLLFIFIGSLLSLDSRKFSISGNWKKGTLNHHLRYSIMVLTLPFKLMVLFRGNMWQCMRVYRSVSLHQLFKREEKKEIFKLSKQKMKKKKSSTQKREP